MPTLIDAFPLVKSLRDAVFLSATISETEQLTPTMRRIRFSGKRLQGVPCKPGQHVRLQVAGLGESLLRLHPHDALRTYSVYDADPDLGTLDIVMLDHRGEHDAVTPARRWSSASGVGDHVQFTKPQGNFVVRHDAPYHAVCRRRDSVGRVRRDAAIAAGTAHVYGVVEAATRADHLPLARSIQQVERGDASAKDSAVLADAAARVATA